MDQMETLIPQTKHPEIDHLSERIGEVPYSPWPYANRPSQLESGKKFEDYYKSPSIDRILSTLPEARPTDEYLRPELVAKAEEEALGAPNHNATKQLQELDKRLDAEFLRKNLSKQVGAIIFYPGLVLTGSDRKLTRQLADTLHNGNMTAINKALLARSISATEEANELKRKIETGIGKDNEHINFYQTDIKRLQNLAQTTLKLSQILEKFKLVDTRPSLNWQDAINTPNPQTLKIA